ncbi:MAG: AAA family ATPase, partial [Clostridia bacterium]|nr:AAA family ATPase [Clostridia bacterium]
TALFSLDEYWALEETERLVLAFAAVFHDIGKITATKIEDGKIVSPNHAKKGAHLTRELLWRVFGFSGEKEDQQTREAVVGLVYHHAFPPLAVAESHPTKTMLKIAALGELAPAFSLRLLYLLALSDLKGRVCQDADLYHEQIEYFRSVAQEAECFTSPYPFPSPFARRAYFCGKSNTPDQIPYNPTWGEVVMLSALPGSGKDTYIKKHFPDLEMISLDDIRQKLGISPKDEQGKVIAHAKERAKALLRQKTPFIYNATNLTREVRGKQIALFERYGASVRVVFLECEWEEELRRNRSRKAEVPEGAIMRMLSKLEIPECWECQQVEWLIH